MANTLVIKIIYLNLIQNVSKNISLSLDCLQCTGSCMCHDKSYVKIIIPQNNNTFLDLKVCVPYPVTAAPGPQLKHIVCLLSCGPKYMLVWCVEVRLKIQYV